MRSVAGPGRDARSSRLSGVTRASLEGARARAATSRESCRLVRGSAERQRGPSRAWRGEGNRQRVEMGAALDLFGVGGAARVHGPVRNWRGPTRRLASEQSHVDNRMAQSRVAGLGELFSDRECHPEVHPDRPLRAATARAVPGSAPGREEVSSQSGRCPLVIHLVLGARALSDVRDRTLSRCRACLTPRDHR